MSRGAIVCFGQLVVLTVSIALAAEPAAKGKGEWKSLFDGKTLKGWKTPQFGGEGKVYVKDGAVVMEMGNNMTGIAWTGPLPTMDYEISLEGKRIDGSDFFCTTTFPVGKDPCSLVVGGWGGSLVGLSSIDGYDASENPTTATKDFKNDRWYRILIRVTKKKIEAWIDDTKMVDCETEGHKISIRMEVDLCRPLGVCTWSTKGAVRNIRIRELAAEEKDKQN
jgi:hypothetical protein